MLKVRVKKATTTLSVDDSQPHLNREEDDDRHAEKRALGVQRRPGIADTPGTACGAQRPQIYGLHVFET